MRIKVMRKVEVKICDFCGDEATYLDTCCLCGKEGCQQRDADQKLKHWAYHISDAYNYKTRQHGSGSVCKGCGQKAVTLDILFGILTE